MIVVPYYCVLNDENSRNLFRNEDVKMKTKFYIKSLALMQNEWVSNSSKLAMNAV